MTILYCNHVEQTQTGISAGLTSGFRLQADFLEDHLLRIAIVPEEGFETDRTWMIGPEENPPVNGRGRLSLRHFTLPPVTHGEEMVESSTLKLEIETHPLRLAVFQKNDGQWHEILRDRENGAWQWLETIKSFRHFHTLSRTDRHYGLGDKAGPMDRTRRRFKCLQTDALGYDAELSDPLYKHAPFFIVHRSSAPACGLLYDTCSETVFDFGSEHSNYFNPFRHVEVQEKGVVLYVIAGPQIRNIVPRLMQLAGMQAMPPRWALGFAFSAMAHTDAANAQETILEFAATMRGKKLPISALHLGSGYTQKQNGRRYVFKWNMEKFPNRDGFFEALRKQGLHGCANVKPVLLDDHDNYKMAAEKGWFVQRKDGTPAVERFWDGAGAQLDFTNSATVKFWKQGITGQLLDAGFDGIWNDNNEAELWDETATLDGYGKRIHAMSARPLHALQMMRASHEAILEKKPGERPYTISRAGPIGIARYGETWTGDNDTSWHTLKWNLRQGLSMGLSGFPLTGHDIGGFSGPAPSPELLVRWFQMMALHPRAVMNSWKPEEAQKANTPFMNEEVTGMVRKALELRYRFLPFLYSLLYQCHKTGHPIARPLFYDFNDDECHDDHDAFMLGSDVLVAPVVHEGEASRPVWLPETPGGWYDFETTLHHEGGREISVDASLERLPLFIRAGAILPLAKSWQEHAPHDATAIEIRLYPANTAKGEYGFDFLQDDGISVMRNDDVNWLQLRWTNTSVSFDCSRKPVVPFETTCPTLGKRKLVSRSLSRL